METIIIQNAAKRFKNHIILRDINLKCQSGQICGIIGHNGSGKSVLFKCICGFLKLDSGTILVHGKQIGKEMDILKHAGIIIEGPAYIGNLSGIDNLEFLYRICNKKNTQHLRDVMSLVGLDSTYRTKAGKYSMGMKQRLAIAQAIMEDQEILILDEPMNGLDKKGMNDMRNLFLSLKDMGKTIVLASHNKEDINILCNKVYELEDGILSPIV